MVLRKVAYRGWTNGGRVKTKGGEERLVDAFGRERAEPSRESLTRLEQAPPHLFLPHHLNDAIGRSSQGVWRATQGHKASASLCHAHTDDRSSTSHLVLLASGGWIVRAHCSRIASSKGQITHQLMGDNPETLEGSTGFAVSLLVETYKRSLGGAHAESHGS